MGLLPNNNITIGQNVEVTTQPTKTYYFDIENNRIVGIVDGIDAMKQAIYKILQTERYAYLIYDWDYGTELEGLIGKDPLFVFAEIERRIAEALKQDDRILSITDFKINQISKSNFVVSFTANTTEGEVNMSEVTVSV